MEAGRYLIRITKALAWLDDAHRIQVASFNPDIGKAGRFLVNKGSAGSVSIAPSSCEVIRKEPSESTHRAPLVFLAEEPITSAGHKDATKSENQQTV